MSFKVFFFLFFDLAAILFSQAEPFLEILVDGHWRNTILCKYFEIGPLAKDEMLFEDFLFLALAAILFNGAEPLWPSWISD